MAFIGAVSQEISCRYLVLDNSRRRTGKIVALFWRLYVFAHGESLKLARTELSIKI
jgi:hypothetical protein